MPDLDLDAIRAWVVDGIGLHDMELANAAPRLLDALVAARAERDALRAALRRLVAYDDGDRLDPSTELAVVVTEEMWDSAWDQAQAALNGEGT